MAAFVPSRPLALIASFSVLLTVTFAGAPLAAQADEATPAPTTTPSVTATAPADPTTEGSPTPTEPPAATSTPTPTPTPAPKTGRRLSAAAANVPCTTGTIYGINAGHIVSIDTATGATTNVTTTDATAPNPNALAITSGGAKALYLQNGAFAANAKPLIHAYNRSDETTTTTEGAPLPYASNGLLRGGINLKNSIYYYSGPRTGSPSIADFYAYNLTTATPIGYVGSVTITGLTAGNGDLTFDALGNMLVVIADGASNNKLYRIPNFPTTAQSAPTALSATRLADLPSGVAENGITFDSDGYLYVSAGNASANSVYKIDPNSGDVETGYPKSIVTSPSAPVVDLADCENPGTIQATTTVTDRAGGGDEFGLSITTTAPGGIDGGNTATTANGGTTATAGPVLGIPGKTYTVTQTSSGNNDSSYVSPITCKDTTNGDAVIATTPVSSSSASFVYPTAAASGGALPNIVCSFATAEASPSLSVTKTASPASFTAPGQTITYSFVATNTGDVPLTGVKINDTPTAPAGALNAAPACQSLATPTATCTGTTTTLAVGQSATFTATYTTTAADVTENRIRNSATTSGTAPNASTVTSGASTATVPAAKLTITKSASPGSISASGQTITYTFLVANTGLANLTGVGVTDTQTAPAGALTSGPTCAALSSPTATCTGATTDLAAGQTATFTATYVTTTADISHGSVADSATAAGTTPAGTTLTTATPATASVAVAGLTIVKSATPGSVSTVGQTITYSFLLTNTGTVPLTRVGVNDTQTPPAGSLTTAPACQSKATPTAACSGASTTLAVGQSATFTATYVITALDVANGSVGNSATATGTPPAGPAVTSGPSPVSVPVGGLTIVKSAAPGSISEPGQTVTYTYVVTNSGTVPLTAVGVDDVPDAPAGALTTGPTCQALTNPPGACSGNSIVLLPGQSATFTATYVVTADDIASGSVGGTATATGTPPAGPPVTSAPSPAAIPVSGLSLAKSASPQAFNAAGQTITVSFLVRNTGTVTMTGVSVNDTQIAPAGALNGPPTCQTKATPAATCSGTTTVLEPGQSALFTATYTTTAADLTNGTIDDSATATGTPPVGSAVTTPASTATVLRAGIDLTKTANPTQVTAAGQVVTYTYVATNTQRATLSGVQITDAMDDLSALTCDPTAPATLAQGDALTCTATYTVKQGDVDDGALDNTTASVVGTPANGADVTADDDAPVTAAADPSIQLEKTAVPIAITDAGDSVTYTFVATNTGNVTLTGVEITDDLDGLSALDCTPNAPTSLAPDAVLTCTATYDATQLDVDSGSFTNTASVSGTPPTGPDVTDGDDAIVTSAPTPGIQIVKSANPTSVTTAGQTVTYTYVATNVGNVTLTAVSIADTMTDLSALACDPTAPTTLEPLETLTCTATYVVTQTDVDNGELQDTAATTTGTPPTGAPVTDDDDAPVTATPAPGISITKSASPSNVTTAGQTVTYSYLVTNTGNVTLTDVGVTDPMVDLSALTCDPTVPATLAPNATISCTATYTVQQADVDNGALENTAATTTGTPPTGAPVADDDAAPVTATSAPAINLVKTADLSTVTAAGQTVTYTYVATNTGNVTLSSVGITDPMDDLSPLTCDPTAPATLAPSATITCTATYTVTQADVDDGALENSTATAVGTPPAGDPVDATDDAPVTATPAPAITLVKTADPTTVTAAGQKVTYTYVATNTGNVTLTTAGITDPMVDLSTLDCDPTTPATLAPNATITCTATYTVKQADVDNGQLENGTATAVGTPPAGDPVDATDDAPVTATSTPAITVAKTADRTTVTAAGQTVTYTYLVTNTGNVTLTDVGVTDPMVDLSTLTCDPTAPATLAPNATITCTATYTVKQADVDNGALENSTATAVGIPPNDDPVTGTDDAPVTATPAPGISVIKTADRTTVTAAGQTVTYTYVATNTGNVTLSTVGITDPMADLSALACDPTVPATLAPNATITCTATYTTKQADVDNGALENSTATAVGTPPTGDPVTGTDDAPVTATPAPGISLTKTADPTTVTAAGQTVTYTYVATNTGNVTLSVAGITDPMVDLSALTCDPTVPATLAPDATITCTATYTVKQADVDAEELENSTASVVGTPPNGEPVDDTDDAPVTALPSPAIDIVKSANPTSVTQAGDKVTFTYVVTNTGNVTLSNVGVTDPMDDLSDLDCDPTVPTTLAPGATITCDATYTVTQDDVDNGQLENSTAKTVGTPPNGEPVDDSDDAPVLATPAPALTIVKTANPISVLEAGDQVTYTYLVTNTGNVTLTDVDVTDPMDGLSDLDCDPAVPTTLAPNATITCTATYTATQTDVDNGALENSTATATGTPPNDDPVDATDDAPVGVGPAPAISIVKTADPTTVTKAGDTVTYTYVVTNNGNQTLSNVGVTDSMAGLSGLTCDPTVPATLAPQATITCTATYTVTQADIDNGALPSTSGIAVGTAPGGEPVAAEDVAPVAAGANPAITLDKSANRTSVDTADQTVTYTYLVTNTGNVTLTGVGVTDPMLGLSQITCDPIAPATLAPGATQTCTATYFVTQNDVDAGQLPNTTATATGTPSTGDPVDDSDDAPVSAGVSPAITIDKSADPTEVTEAGQTVTYTYVATNTGNVTLTGVEVKDPMVGLSGLVCDKPAPVTLIPGAVLTCTATYVVTQADVDRGALENTGATVVGEPPTGDQVDDSDDAPVTAEGDPAVSLEKSATPMTVSAVGDVVTYTFVVTNTGNVTLDDVTIDDNLDGLSEITCETDPAAALAPGETLTCTATYTATVADVDAGSILNEATATATGPGEDGVLVSDLDDAVVSTVPAPGIALVKTVDATEVKLGATLTYSFLASNTGNVTLTDVTITDELAGLSALTCDQETPATLEPGEQLSCTATYTVTAADQARGRVDNSATVTGDSPTGVLVSGADVIGVKVLPAAARPVPPRGTLPNTGGPSAVLLGLGALSSLAGGLLLVGRRRRRQDTGR